MSDLTMYPMPILTVDVVLLTLIGGSVHVGLLQRPEEPFKGSMALPGGFVRVNCDLDVEQTALRMLKDKVSFEPRHLEQVQTVAGPDRDPRGWSASVLYLALVNYADVVDNNQVMHGITWFPFGTLPELAFDHNRLIEQAVARLRAKSSYCAMPAYLLPKVFTLRQFQEVTEILTGVTVDSANFRRKVLEQNLIEPTGLMTCEKVVGRPAELYKVPELPVLLRRALV